MIEKLGGTTVDMDQIQVHPTVQQDKSYLIGEAVRGEGAILVSQEGKRFGNELDTRDNVTASINKLPEKSAYLVFDSGVKDRVKAIAQYEEMGFVEEGKTIDELAGKINVPKEELTKTLDTWNASVKKQKKTKHSAEQPQWIMIYLKHHITQSKSDQEFITQWVA